MNGTKEELEKVFSQLVAKVNAVYDNYEIIGEAEYTDEERELLIQHAKIYLSIKYKSELDKNYLYYRNSNGGGSDYTYLTYTALT